MKNSHVTATDTVEILRALRNDGLLPITTEKKLVEALDYVSEMKPEARLNIRTLRRHLLNATKVLTFKNSIVAFFENLETEKTPTVAVRPGKKKKNKKITSRKSPPVKVKARRTGAGLIASIIHRIKVTGANAEEGAVADFKRQYELKKKKKEIGIPLYSPGPAIDQESDEDPLHRK